MYKIKSKSTEYQTYESMYRKFSLFTDGAEKFQNIKTMDVCYDAMQLADQDYITCAAVKALSQYISTFTHMAWKTSIKPTC
jgi:hypothetical protein